jgi:hypothetical protein
MAFSKNTLRLFKWLYWIILTLAHIYIVYIMFVTDRAILAILWLITGFIMIFIFYFYYFPWGDPGTTWPPYIAACPDYLTSIGNNQCVDYVGLHSPKLKRTAPGFIPTDPSYIFNSSGSMSQKAANAQLYSLTWEGVL